MSLPVRTSRHTLGAAPALPSHDTNIDALRGLAVLGVVCHHLFAHAGVHTPFLGEFGGLLGVQLFFLVSGYLVVQSAQAYPLSGYLVRRACRIFPAYWTVVLGVSLLHGKLTAAEIAGHEWAFVANLLAFTHLVPEALMRFDVLTVSWTLTVELVWYALVPLLVWLAPAGQPRRYWAGAILAMMLFSSVWVFGAQRGWFDALFADAIARAGVSPVSEFMRFAFIVNAFPAQLAFFLFGCGLWRWREELAAVPGWLLLAVGLLLVPFPTHWNGWLGLNPSFASGLGLAALFVLVLRQRRLRLGALAALGRISYSVYLVHVPVILAVFGGWTLHPWLGAALAGIAIVVVSALSYRLIELPGIALGRRLARSLGHRNEATPAV